MENYRQMIRLALVTVENGLAVLESVVRYLCVSDKDIAKGVADLYRRVETIYSGCGGAGYRDAVARMLNEIAKCQDIECVRSLVEEYKAMLFGDLLVK